MADVEMAREVALMRQLLAERLVLVAELERQVQRLQGGRED